MVEPRPCRCSGDKPEVSDLTCELGYDEREVKLTAVTCHRCGRGTQAPTKVAAIAMWNSARYVSIGW